MNTASISLAVTPTVVSTFLSHYFNRKPLRQRPTAHLSYDEGLQLIRSFLTYSSNHTVEELQAFTGQWVPYPAWVTVDEINIPESHTSRAAELLIEQLGEDGVERVGGKKWWQWRKEKTNLTAEWIEMRSDCYERKKNGGESQRVMLYVHGGAYYFGSVDEHRYQLQRHARKLRARVFAPEYRLAPQFPFPCGLQDCLAAYLMLLETQDSTTIILAGDSAGAGMILSMLIMIRDAELPMPTGAILISPWVDLTHSFPSVSTPCPFDYIPQSGFHHKPSKAWPPPNEDEWLEIEKAKKEIQKNSGRSKTDSSTNGTKDDGDETTQPTGDSSRRCMKINLGTKETTLKEQLQMYTTNDMLSHPLVSPVLQATLGGLPPLFIMVGGGEILRDEQIYLAHKCANPQKYAPPNLTEEERARLDKYNPTDVHLQVWEDMCHVGPTLSFTRPAKFMYRSVAQFGAWALARAQKTGIEIMDDDEISVISSSSSGDGEGEARQGKAPGQQGQQPRAMEEMPTSANITEEPPRQIGKSGDPLPPFQDHMIRQRVSRHGKLFPLEPEVDIKSLAMEHHEIGVIKEGPVKNWLSMRQVLDKKFSTSRTKIHKKRIKEAKAGYESFGEGEFPPPSALAGRRPIAGETSEWRWKKHKSFGLALWSGWGSKHDEMTVGREAQATQLDQADQAKAEGASAGGDSHRGSIGNVPTVEEPEGAKKESQEQNGEGTGAGGLNRPSALSQRNRSHSHTKVVVDDHQTDEDGGVAGRAKDKEDKDAADEQRREDKEQQQQNSPSLVVPAIEMGSTGKRPHVDGIAMPFTVKKDADTASMITLYSRMESAGSLGGHSRAPSAASTTTNLTAGRGHVRGNQSLDIDFGVAGRRPKVDGIAMPFSLMHLKKDGGRGGEDDGASMLTLDSMAPSMMTTAGQGVQPSSEVAEGSGAASVGGGHSRPLSVSLSLGGMSGVGSPLAREVNMELGAPSTDDGGGGSGAGGDDEKVGEKGVPVEEEGKIPRGSQDTVKGEKILVAGESDKSGETNANIGGAGMGAEEQTERPGVETFVTAEELPVVSVTPSKDGGLNVAGKHYTQAPSGDVEKEKEEEEGKGEVNGAKM
ncbi:AB hydrolase superfamily [Zalerion maritima]|uniref:AB hydrolase superfamily n=1 Tax=Zalerion maritima TaxID=339359 RepID=A0AAD5WMV2_9PEZI|nr:AB hydrolase superfamily [Zalerion maritima]